MLMLEQIVKILALLMVSIVSLAVITFVVLAGGNMLWEFIKDQINIRRRNRK